MRVPLWSLLSLSIVLHGLGLAVWAWMEAGSKPGATVGSPSPTLVLVSAGSRQATSSLATAISNRRTADAASVFEKEAIRSDLSQSNRAIDAVMAKAGSIRPLVAVPPLIPEARDLPSPDHHLQGSAQTTVGHPARGVVLILDCSGSMYEGYGGTTRLELARAQLTRLLHALPEGTPFRLILYAHRARVSGAFVPVSPATLAAADAWWQEDFDGGGGTNLASAFREAAKLPAARWIVATDGDLHVSSDELIASAREALYTFSVRPTLTIEAIEPRPATGDRTLLQQLATATHGTYTPCSALPNLAALNAPAR